MRRRTFVAGLAATALLPVSARGQTKPVRIAFLNFANPEPYWTLMRELLRDLGYVEGKNLQLDYRAANGNPEVLAAYAAEIARSGADLVIAVPTPAVKAAMQAAPQIPIVFFAGNPVETGLVASLQRPGGNVTGVTLATFELTAKMLELVRETMPTVRRVTALINASDLIVGKPLAEQIREAARPFKLDVQEVVTRPEEITAAFDGMIRNRASAVIVQPSFPRAQTCDLALKHRIAVFTYNAAWTDAGAFVAYSPDLRDACSKAAAYVDRILKGAKPAELPVQLPTKFQLVINQKTARAIGVNVPQSVLVRAERVIS